MSEPNQLQAHDLTSAVARAGRIYNDFAQHLSDRRVAPACTRADMLGAFENTLDDAGVGIEAMLDEFEQTVLPNSMTTPHPRYAGLVNSSPLAAAPIADLLVSMLNNNGGAFHQSPAGTAAEQEVVRTFCSVLGYPADAAGLILPGGTFANLHGLLLARTAKFPLWRTKGQAAAHEPRLYTSSASHFSIARIANVIGLGEDHVVSLPTCGRGSLDTESLRAQVAADLDAGRTPFAIVATIGTTGTGAIDDILGIALIAREFGLWLHVDCCYGGAAALLDERRSDFAGLELADSVAVDPHKWFFMPITAGLTLTRHPEVERDAFDLDAAYIPGDGQLDAFCRGIPTSRRSSGLTVWATLRAHGLETIREAVRRNIAQMRRLEGILEGAGGSVLPEGRLSIACVRFDDVGLDAAETDAFQVAIAEQVVASGEAWFATTRHAGKTWLRFNTTNLHTRDVHIDEIAAAVIRASSSRDLGEDRPTL